MAPFFWHFFAKNKQSGTFQINTLCVCVCVSALRRELSRNYMAVEIRANFYLISLKFHFDTYAFCEKSTMNSAHRVAKLHVPFFIKRGRCSLVSDEVNDWKVNEFTLMSVMRAQTHMVHLVRCKILFSHLAFSTRAF